MQDLLAGTIGEQPFRFRGKQIRLPSIVISLPLYGPASFIREPWKASCKIKSVVWNTAFAARKWYDESTEKGRCGPSPFPAKHIRHHTLCGLYRLRCTGFSPKKERMTLAHFTQKEGSL